MPILEKIRGKGEPTLDARVSSQKPFGLRTFFHGRPDSNGLKNPVKLFGSQKISWVERSEVPTNATWIDEWKVLMTAVQGTSAAVETKFLSKPIIAAPGTACTETYLVAGHFDNETDANHYAAYLRTFTRSSRTYPSIGYGPTPSYTYGTEFLGRRLRSSSRR